MFESSYIALLWFSSFLDLIFVPSFRASHFLSNCVKTGTGKMMKIPVKNLQTLECEFHIYQRPCNGNLVTFVFSSKASPAPLNTPTPTPAPDQGVRIRSPNQEPELCTPHPMGLLWGGSPHYRLFNIGWLPWIPLLSANQCWMIPFPPLLSAI